MAKNSSKVENTTSPSGVFIGMALDMSWRLAIAVLVPIIGGFELDNQFETSPFLFILGFVLAMAGMYLVMKQTVKTANSIEVPVAIIKPTKDKDKKA
jgi:F0F1-type ATP synthase assembly protein I